MPHVQAAIVGGGQAGLAMSRCLTDRGIDHVVFERGRIAERWRSERWSSLRLLTPNWQTRLPGFRYDGPDPDGYMTMPEVVRFFDAYARSFAAPIECETTVRSVEPDGRRFRVEAGGRRWLADSVVIATGYSDRSVVPATAAGLSPDVTQVVPAAYRDPGQLRTGGVLIVGASATGVQLADELSASGRRVVLAAGRHLRMPRTYRGRDILWWLERMGVLSQAAVEVFDIGTSRHQPSFQLVGRPDRASIDLVRLQRAGVEIVGRMVNAEGLRVQFDDDLVATTAGSDVKLAGLLRRIDDFAIEQRLETDGAPPGPFEPSWPFFTDARTEIDLRGAGITSVIWATGYRRAYPWLRVPGAIDTRGEIVHFGGVTPANGLFVLGLQFLRRRNSSFIDGVGRDAVELAEHIVEHCAHNSLRPALGHR